MKQLKLLKNSSTAYGGTLRNKRKGRTGPRPLTTKNSLHLVLRSSKAKGKWSFLRPENRRKIDLIINKFATKYAVRMISLANVGNHLHAQIRLTNLHTYKPFIRALTSAIATVVTKSNLRRKSEKSSATHFWDYRPFTRIVVGLQSFLNLRHYIRINQYEGHGFDRETAEYIVKRSPLLDST